MRDTADTSFANDEIDLSSLLKTLWLGKIWIALAALLSFGLGGYYGVVVATPYYTASSVVVLESRQEQVVDIESVITGLGGDQLTINTEVEVLKSRGLARKLVEQLALIEDPEFNHRLRTPSKYSVGALIELVTGSADDGVPPPDSETVLNAVIDNVLNVISVSNVRQSYVFQITVVTQSPQKSALIANNLADIYVRNQLEAKFEATEQATEWLSGRVSELQVALEQAAASVKDFNAETDLINPETLTALNRQLKEQRDRLIDAQTARAAAEARLITINTALETNDLDVLVSLTDDRTLSRLIEALNAGQTEARAAFDARVQQIIARVEQDEQRAIQQRTTLTTAVAELEAQITRQSADLVTLQQLEREAEASRLIYEFFLNRLKELSVQEGIQQADSRILSTAVVPSGPSAPRLTIILVISLILGAAVASVLLLVRELVQNTFRTAEDLESYTGITVMGQVPLIPARHRRGVLDYLIQKPTSAAAEAIRNLRTSLLLSSMDKATQIIMSTSSVPGEGKTTQSIALTQNLSGLGKKVLLVEGDIRRRVFSEYFSIEKKQGLLAVLAAELDLEDAVTYNDQLKADILIGEASNINATDVYSSHRFKDLLRDMRSQYDYIIIDTPPVLAVPDARVIGQWVDAILYTVHWDETPRQQVSEGLHSLHSVNIKVSGLVLSQISLRKMRRYGYGTSYKNYEGYYDN